MWEPSTGSLGATPPPTCASPSGSVYVETGLRGWSGPRWHTKKDSGYVCQKRGCKVSLLQWQSLEDLTSFRDPTPDFWTQYRHLDEDPTPHLGAGV